MTIELHTVDYQMTYGHTPRGRGSWGFASSRDGNPFVLTGSMTYGEARRQAIKIARLMVSTASTSAPDPRLSL